MKQKQISKQRHHLAIAALGLLVGSTVLQGCKDDNVLTGQPAWLGNSIYERLEEDGQYTTMLRLIDDLGQHEVLSHTGSKTLFAANDSAFKAWFAKNNWGVSRYEQLSLSQKKLLLNNAMVNNAYLIELLSNGKPTGEDKHPEEGRTMRRKTATDIFDSVQVMRPDQMPNTPTWDYFRNRGTNIAILKDDSPSPMIHFLPMFMKINKFTNEDLELLTNHQANDINEAWVNGKKVIERDITCKNGYIQKVNGVIEASPNMAQIIHQHANMSDFAKMMDRFSAPFRNDAHTKEYNRLYNNEDSVYVLRYYDETTAMINEWADDNNNYYYIAPDNKTKVRDLLRFDPGWNEYISNSGDKNMNYDAGAMLVPTNEAIEKWWNNEGRDFQEEYGTIENLPIETVKSLIRVNQLPILTEAIPSKFNQILNDAKVEMNVTKADVDSVFMGCNGVVYMTNKLFTPAEFAAVSGPAMAHPTLLKIIYSYIKSENYLPYLLSMDSRYSLILPTNTAMLRFIDPFSYGKKVIDGKEAPQVMEIFYDDATQTIRAYSYDSTVDTDGTITIDESTRLSVSSSIISNCMKRLIDQLIIVGDVEDGHEYYKSKGGTPLRVSRTADGRIAFAGGWQINHNQLLPVNSEDVYTKENGKSYVINQIPLTTDKSVYMTLEEYKEEGKDTLFLSLLDNDGADLLNAKLRAKFDAAKWAKGENKNLTLFDNYNYTVYVPTDKAIQEQIDKGILPTWEDYEAMTEENCGSEEAAEEAKAVIKNIIVNFLRYHVQDHAVLIGMAPEMYEEQEQNGVTVKVPKYENIYETMKRNNETGRFVPLTVNNAPGQMWVKDAIGNKYDIRTSDGLYNRICREYWFKDTGECYMASDAVIQQIDGVLQYEENPTPWRELVKKVIKN